jgi:hypothetical protein
MKAYREENDIEPGEFDHDLDEFDLPSVGDVMTVLVRDGGRNFDRAAFLRDIRRRLENSGDAGGEKGEE